MLFKLYAGGYKSKLDILELMTRTVVDRDALQERAKKFRMDKSLARVLALADE